MSNNYYFFASERASESARRSRGRRRAPIIHEGPLAETGGGICFVAEFEAPLDVRRDAGLGVGTVVERTCRTFSVRTPTWDLTVCRKLARFVSKDAVERCVEVASAGR
mmetsp:Transcript_1520/g.4529  ORF Transcript_1520/g.4529 Transcript_1520/m.4529 type:complete len:108 (-) Transcript_1520:379-702(-)